MHPSLVRAIAQYQAVQAMIRNRPPEYSSLYKALVYFNEERYQVQKTLNAGMDPVEVLNG